MIFKCPGSQKFKHPHPEFIKCTFCGKEIEIWSDEAKAKCVSCKKEVFRESAQGCLDWCRYAKECVGEEVYKKYKKNKGPSAIGNAPTRRISKIASGSILQSKIGGKDVKRKVRKRSK